MNKLAKLKLLSLLGFIVFLAAGCSNSSSPSSDASLSDLTISSGSLNPVFNTAVLNYTVDVDNAVASVTVTPTATNANATIQVNGTTVASGAASAPIALTVGDNIVTITVTAQNGTTTQNYVVTVRRLIFNAYLKASNTEGDDNFGRRVALSGDGNTAAVAAWFEDGDGSAEDDNSVPGAGAVYVYKRNTTDGTWSQLAYVKSPAPVQNQLFGFSIALSRDGSVLAVGAPDNITPGNGKVYVYIVNATSVSAATELTRTGESADAFGYSVALSDDGSWLAAGAPFKGVGYDPGTGPVTVNNAGVVYVFEDNGGWVERSIVIAEIVQPAPPNTYYVEADSRFGSSVALSEDGSVLAVSASDEDNAGTDQGAAYIFNRDAVLPVYEGVERIVATTPTDSDRLGLSLSLDDTGTRLALGTQAGEVHVFVDSTGWGEQAVITATNHNPSDFFGRSVSLSSDGNTLLVGASAEQGDGTYITTPDTLDLYTNGAGAAYRFTYTTSWTQTEYIKASNTDDADNFGVSVSISDDGSRVLMGAHLEDSDATGINGDQESDPSISFDAGAAYLYDVP